MGLLTDISNREKFIWFWVAWQESKCIIVVLILIWFDKGAIYFLLLSYYFDLLLGHCSLNGFIFLLHIDLLVNYKYVEFNLILFEKFVYIRLAKTRIISWVLYKARLKIYFYLSKILRIKFLRCYRHLIIQ